MKIKYFRPDSIIKVNGEGIPIHSQGNISKKNMKKGDLYIKFNIIFPT